MSTEDNEYYEIGRRLTLAMLVSTLTGIGLGWAYVVTGYRPFFVLTALAFILAAFVLGYLMGRDTRILR